MRARVRLRSVTFGTEFPKPSGWRGAWPFVDEKTHGLYLDGGLLFMVSKSPNGSTTDFLCYHPGGVQMNPYLEDVMDKQEPQLAAVKGGR